MMKHQIASIINCPLPKYEKEHYRYEVENLIVEANSPIDIRKMMWTACRAP